MTSLCYFLSNLPDIFWDKICAKNKSSEEKMKLLSRKLSISATKYEQGSTRQYKFDYANQSLEYQCIGTLSMHFERCIAHNAASIEQNTEIRNMFFLRCFLDYLNSIGLSYLLPTELTIKNGEKLLYQHFFHFQTTGKINYIQNTINKLVDTSKNFAAKTLFFNRTDYNSYNNIREIKSCIRKDLTWRKILQDANNPDPCDFACQAFQAALGHPLLNLMLRKWAEFLFLAETEFEYNKKSFWQQHAKAYQITIGLLIQNSIKTTATSITFVPTVHALLAIIQNKLRLYCERKEYTISDIIRFYGELSLLAADTKSSHSFTSTQIDNVCVTLTRRCGSNSFFHLLELRDDIKNVSEKAPHGDFIEKGNNTFKFSIKPYRLIFHALALAEKANNSTDFSCEQAFDEMLQIGRLASTRPVDLVNLYNGYHDDLLIFSAAYICALDKLPKKAFIDYLLKLSNQFEIKNRTKQIAAIYILAYTLYEDESLTYAQRQEIFQQTYGTTSYQLQNIQWEMLDKQSSFYIHKIKDTYQSLFTNKSFYTDKQPFYFFYYHLYPKKHHTHRNENTVQEYCHKAFSLRKEIWASLDDHKEKSTSDRIKQCIDLLNEGISIKEQFFSTDISQIENIENNNCGYLARTLAYGIQAVLYAIANILNYTNSDEASQLDNDASSQLLECLFFADYICRKSNLEYRAYIENTPEQNNLYLLCGAFRCVCALPPLKIVYQMPSFMKKEYALWLKKEKNRYYYLLAYLLSLSDFFEEDEKKSLLNLNQLPESTDEIMFLPYDHLSHKAILRFPTDPKEWHTII